MKTWQESFTVLPASEATIEGEPPHDLAKNFRIYFDSPDRDNDPYHRGVVVEEWTDGRFYIIDGNHEVLGTLDEVEAYLKEFLVREQFIDESGKILPAAKSHQELADEALALATDDHWGSPEQIEAENAFTERVKHTISAAAFEHFEEFCLKATSQEIIEEGLDLILKAHANRLRADCGIPSDYPAPKADAANAPVEADSVQALFDSLFPTVLPRIRIRGGGDIPVDSECGSICAHALRSAYAFGNLPEVDEFVVARIAAEACEVYING